MKIIKKMIKKVVNWAHYEGHDMPPEVCRDTVSHDEFDDPLRFNVYNAIGGKILKISNYNMNTDRVKTTLYIITNEDNLGEEIGQIITREMLTR